MTGIAVAGIRQGWRRGVRAVGCAMLLHYFLNFPIFIPHLFGLTTVISKTVWIQIITGYGVIFFVVLWIVVWKRLFGHAPTLKRILGTTTCRGCGRTFEPALLTLNFALWTGQRCPHCKRWYLYPFWWGRKK